jgi:acetyl esterase/lipase
MRGVAKTYPDGVHSLRDLTLTVPRASLLLALLISTACGHPYEVREALRYDTAIGYHGSFDLYEPRSDSARTARPAVVVIHGGAWRGGDKAWGEQFAEELCPFGYVVVAINYRLSGRPGGTWPAQIEDVQKAIRYLRTHAASLRIDPERVATLGMSAGGHLATMAALRDDGAGSGGRVQVAVNLAGEHDLAMPPREVMADFDDILTAVMGHGPPWSRAQLADISTVTFARPDVSLLTVHGTGDDNVYVAQGERITEALRAKGADVEFVRIGGEEGQCHEDCWTVSRARRAIHRFLDRTLRHDGEAYYEALHGERSPLGDPGEN